MIRQLRREGFVEGEKGFEQVLFVQREPAVDEPLGRVIVRKENVVNVYPDSRRETRQDLEKFETDVAAKLDCMTGVDEENVVSFETREEVDIHLLDPLLN